MCHTTHTVLFASLLIFAGCQIIGIPLSNNRGSKSKPFIDPSEHCAAIRQQLLTVTPPGTPAERVVAFVSRELIAHGETDDTLIRDATMLRNGAGLIPTPSCDTRGWRYGKVGSKCIIASFETPSLSFLFGIPVHTKNVAQVCYAFNKNEELIDIGVSTHTQDLP